MKILLLSAYDAQSHQYWHKGMIRQLPQYQWTVLTLPPRYFAWRVRGNALSWFTEQYHVLNQEYDLIIATSMVDLVGLKGLIPRLANIPSVVYFHENQFAYPMSGYEKGLLEVQMMSVFSALSATKVVFNSHYNKATFLSGLSQLFKKLPDHKPKNIAALIAEKSTVLPVPLQASKLNLTANQTSDKLTVLWNHRWEFDKGPELLLAILQQLTTLTSEVVFHIVGQQFRHSPEVFQTIKQQFASILGQFGYIENIECYQQLLVNSDVVLSTASHDFQGLAILEAVQAGATPLLPNALVYPEYFDKQYLYEEGNSQAAAKKLANCVVAKQRNNLPAVPNVESFQWRQLIDEYQALIVNTAQR